MEVLLPEGMPVDDPSLAPIFEAMDDADLPFVHHSFFYEPPYFPGYRDIWGNLAIARMASHPWGAQRLLAYVTLSGMFDRYPTLRIGFAECSGSWLGGWLNRMTYQADYLASRLPETKRTPIEYALDGRIFCGVELDEGPDVVKGLPPSSATVCSCTPPTTPRRMPLPVVGRHRALVARAARRGDVRQARQRERPPLPEDVTRRWRRNWCRSRRDPADASLAPVHVDMVRRMRELAEQIDGFVEWRDSYGRAHLLGLRRVRLARGGAVVEGQSHARAIHREGEESVYSAFSTQVFELVREASWRRDEAGRGPSWLTSRSSTPTSTSGTSRSIGCEWAWLEPGYQIPQVDVRPRSMDAPRYTTEEFLAEAGGSDVVGAVHVHCADPIPRSGDGDGVARDGRLRRPGWPHGIRSGL